MDCNSLIISHLSFLCSSSPYFAFLQASLEELPSILLNTPPFAFFDVEVEYEDFIVLDRVLVGVVLKLVGTNLLCAFEEILGFCGLGVLTCPL